MVVATQAKTSLISDFQNSTPTNFIHHKDHHQLLSELRGRVILDLFDAQNPAMPSILP
jgi:hypothetical protein